MFMNANQNRNHNITLTLTRNHAVEFWKGSKVIRTTEKEVLDVHGIQFRKGELNSSSFRVNKIAEDISAIFTTDDETSLGYRKLVWSRNPINMDDILIQRGCFQLSNGTWRYAIKSLSFDKDIQTRKIIEDRTYVGKFIDFRVTGNGLVFVTPNLTWEEWIIMEMFNVE